MSLQTVTEVVPSTPFFKGIECEQEGRWLDALACYDKSVEIDPECIEAWNNKGNVLQTLNRFTEAVAAYDAGLKIKPDCDMLASNRILALDFVPGLTFEEHQHERREWYRVQAAHIAPKTRHDNVPDTDRKLVIGYVSGDFKEHSAGAGFIRLIENHDKDQFQINCYSTVDVNDTFTVRYRSIADEWRYVHGLKDSALAAQIEADRVDILVDLAGHTAGNRLLAFTYRPAPVQVSMASTGCPTTDYLFADKTQLPEDLLHLYPEQVYYLNTQLPFDAPGTSPDIGPQPMDQNGYITFGCLNRYSKISDTCLALWTSILNQAGSYRLILKDGVYDQVDTRARVLMRLERFGIDTNRVWLMGQTTRGAHLSTYNQIDVTLDPLPYGGGITSWESLWMGVPIVCMLGNSHVARTSAAVMASAGWPEFVSADAEKYIEGALAWAAAPDVRRIFRQSARDRVLRAPSCDPMAYAKEIEQAYRYMWRKWCAKEKKCTLTA